MGKWEMVKLGEVCEVISGSTPSTLIPELWDGDIKWIAPAEIGDSSYYIYDTNKHISAKAGLKPMPIGTVLLSSRAPIGKVAITGSKMCCNQGFKNLVCSDKIHNRYLYRFLKSKTDYLNSLGRGATFKEISKSIVENMEIPLPPLPIQQKIADALDKASALIEMRKAQINKLDLLIKSQFIEMFGDPVTNPKGWPIVKLGDISELKIGPFGTSLHKGDYVEGGHALVNPSHIVDGKIKIDPKLTISSKKFLELSSYELKRGDIILGRRGEMGRCALVDEDGLVCGTGSMIIRPKYQMKAFVLNAILSSPSYKQIFEDKAVGVTMMNLNIDIVASIRVPLLPIHLQEKYIVLNKQVEESKSKMMTCLDGLNINYKSLMQKCFSGEMF